MKSFISLLMVFCTVSLILMFTACEQKGTAQKGGEKIDQAVESTTAALKDATQKVEKGLKK